MAWILGVNNVYDDVLPPVTIEILAAVFFKLLSWSDFFSPNCHELDTSQRSTH